ncbi:hypothetical protein VULLAG_LOCUS23139 [Vulpes lagopus]
MEKDAHADGDYVPKVRRRLARPRPPRSPPPPAPQPRAPAVKRRAHRKAGPAGTARGFRPEARRSPFGSGPSPAPARELSRRLHIRDQRLAPARISGEGREEKDAVTPLSAPAVARAPALGAAAPSGAASPTAREGGARTFLSEPSREISALAVFSRHPPPPREGRPPSPRAPALPGSPAAVPGTLERGLCGGVAVCSQSQNGEETDFFL